MKPTVDADSRDLDASILPIAGFFLGLIALVGLHHLVHISEFVKLNFYLLVWWSFILLLESWNTLMGRPSFLTKGWGFFGELCSLSIVLWFLFEFYNFWLGNWYYVGLESDLVHRWARIYVAFATVLPGLWVVRNTVAWLLPPAFANRPEKTFSTGFIAFIGIIAVVGTIGPFIYPTWTFPLVWGGLLAGVDLFEYRRGGPSFLLEMEDGNYLNLISWLIAGGICGFAWEFWNSLTPSKWIYTVPYLGDLRLFEMPLAGFLGFPPFAAMTWRLFESLHGQYKGWVSHQKWLFWVFGIIFTLAVCWQMDRLIITSTYPSLHELSGLDKAQRQRLAERNITTPLEALNHELEPELRDKLEFYRFAGLWDETGDCLRRAGFERLSALRQIAVPVLTEIVRKCHPAPSSFWRRRVIDWRQRLNEKGPAQTGEVKSVPPGHP